MTKDNLHTKVDLENGNPAFAKPVLYAGRYYSTNVELEHRTKVLFKKIAERWKKKITYLATK